MRFMMLVIPKGYESAQPDAMPDAEAVAKMMKYNEDAREGRRPAQPRRPASRRRPACASAIAGGKPKVTDGPFAEAKECVGGYWMIQVKSKEEAIEWAKRAPMSRRRNHRSAPGPRDGGLPRRRAGGRRRLRGASGRK